MTSLREADTLSLEQIQALLNKSRGDGWYFQPGWGIQYWVNGAVGLLVADGYEGSATVSEIDLMAASQQIARQYVAVVAERDTAQTEVQRLRDGMQRMKADWANELSNREATRDSHKGASQPWFWENERISQLRSVLIDLEHLIQTGFTDMEVLRALTSSPTEAG